MQNPPPNQQGYGYGNQYGTPPNAPRTTPPPGNTGKSSTGLDANVAALLSYIFGFISGLIFFLIEKESRFVRFHAMQSILLNAGVIVAYIAIMILITFVSFISSTLAALIGLLSLLLMLAFFAAAIICIVKAFQGEMFKLPVIGDIAANITNK